MIVEIPLTAGAPRQSQITTLDGRRYRLALDWNQRISRWFVSIETEGGAELFGSRMLACNTDLLRQVRHLPECPPGVLLLLDPTGADREADLYTIGIDHVLAYGRP